MRFREKCERAKERKDERVKVDATIMRKIEKFEDMIAWQKAKMLCILIYALLRDSRDFRFRDKIQSAAVSIMNNIAEGFERGSKKEFVQFLNIAKGSSGEVRSQLYAALDQEYVSEKDFDSIRDCAVILSRRLSSFILYLEGCSTTRRVKRAGNR